MLLEYTAMYSGLHLIEWIVTLRMNWNNRGKNQVLSPMSAWYTPSKPNITEQNKWNISKLRIQTQYLENVIYIFPQQDLILNLEWLGREIKLILIHEWGF